MVAVVVGPMDQVGVVVQVLVVSSNFSLAVTNLLS